MIKFIKQLFSQKNTYKPLSYPYVIGGTIPNYENYTIHSIATHGKDDNLFFTIFLKHNDTIWEESVGIHSKERIEIALSTIFQN